MHIANCFLQNLYTDAAYQKYIIVNNYCFHDQFK
ncbi:predicted protein [Plenodomus lingam JN3]|uniref:Predicted protein n=1 Tax=Leptosphaeria maculans (strain JN3 / isolate v23.1.3 / race Av1-4-5-6-7-8) TaxID=985895 RepID=E4ZQT2_LEPMJ|nr:predicted protein [Plenodomus lingam JN3]CBX94087.1 predicted protein [Plenodomus lingam JN3]